MLILHWARAPNERLVKAVFLPSLLREARDHLHRHLTASVLRCRIYELPFQRDVAVTPDRITAIRSALSQCAAEGGALAVSQTHWLSLMLKRFELLREGGSVEGSGLDELLREMPYVAVHDESDQLFSHIFQLIYAWGSQIDLPQSSHRFAAVQAILRAISRPDVTCHLASLEGACVRGPEVEEGAFRDIRLATGTKELDDALPGILETIAREVVRDPPNEMRWMKDFLDEEALVRAMIRIDHAMEGMVTEEMLEGQEQRKMDLLALRGLLVSWSQGAGRYDLAAGLKQASLRQWQPFGCKPEGAAHEPSINPPHCSGTQGWGVLPHCLGLRHRVNYGVNRRPGLKRRISVPFEAADCPSERSEYAHPDVAIVLTTLAYYHDGLSEAQMREAVAALLSMGPNSQKAIYDDWYRNGRDGMSHTQREALDKVEKIDPTSSQQGRLLWEVYRRNTEAINFWLAYCMLPGETRQFPERLPASAWMLADVPGGRAVGFSGTNDNHRILPYQLTQRFLRDRPVEGTNGMMLGLILRDKEVVSLDVSGKAPAEALLALATESGADAIIDCGALLAGIDTGDAARALLPRLEPTQHRGVVYPESGTGNWMVLERSGRVVPLGASPVQPREAFAIFDEAWCRGSDLKLRPEGRGLLTLGPYMCKDKLMQGAGRLRQLACGQRLTFVAPQDVYQQIKAALAPRNGIEGPTSLEMLQ